MSRNLGVTCCVQCGYRVILKGEPYTREGQTYYSAGDLFRDATCELCGTKYTAWLTDRYGNTAGVCTEKESDYYKKHGECWGCEGCCTEFWDLSYRSTFNDESGRADFPENPIMGVFIVTPKDDGTGVFVQLMSRRKIPDFDPEKKPISKWEKLANFLTGNRS